MHSAFSPRTRIRGLVAWVVLALVVSSCQAEFRVFVAVEEDGSGLVETTTVLDAETVDAILDLDLDADGLVLGDLAQSGWDVGRPEVRDDGSLVVIATKAFGTTSQFAEVMAELSAATDEPGLFDDFRLVRTKTFARVEYQVLGTIDPGQGLTSFSDPELELALGQTLEQVARSYQAEASDIEIEVEVLLPGEIEGPPPPEVIEANEADTRARWTASLADREPTQVRVISATREVSALVLRGVAVVAAVLAGLVLFAQLLRILLPDRRRSSRRSKPSTSRPSSRSTRNPDTGQVPVVKSDQGDDASRGDGGPRVVALDGLGVLYGRGDAPRLLISFSRERASRVTDEEIEAKARQAELGRITTAEFWAAIGVDGDPNALDADYLAQRQLSSGVVRYLRGLRDRGIRLACITNDAPEWASRLKVGHSLDGVIETWVISGTVGVRKPNRSIFEVLRRVTGEPPWAIQLIDDELDNLDAARDFGFDTVWFSADGSRDDARGHKILRSFGAVDDYPADAPEPSSSA